MKWGAFQENEKTASSLLYPGDDVHTVQPDLFSTDDAFSTGG